MFLCLEGVWSQTIDVGLSQETFLDLPGLGDVKLRVDSSLPIAEVSIEPVSNMEISAKDIRARFDNLVKPVPEGEQASSSSSYVIVQGSGTSSRRSSLASTVTATRTKPRFLVTCVVNVDEFDLALTDDLCNFNDIQEIIRVTMSKGSLQCLPNLVKQRDGEDEIQEYRVMFTLDDLQMDNQMYDRGLYHFPVVLNKPDRSVDTPLVRVNLTFDKSPARLYLDQLQVSLSPICLNLEDTLLYVLQEYSRLLTNVGTRDPVQKQGLLPLQVLVFVESSRNLMFLDRICIDEISLQVSVHASVKVFLGLEDTQLNLSRFEKENLWCSGYSLGHTMSRHYLSGALFKAGWVVGSLDVIGNPAAFTRNVTEGIKDFVALPVEGIFNGPWGFLVGLTLGSSSLVKHVSAGTVTSITNFAKSVSRNLDKLSFDSEHWQRNEEARRLKPRGVTEGVLFGLSGVGVSILGALGGLAHHPIQVLVTEGMSPVKLVGGVGKGLVGMVAKPLGGAAELIALTGQGLLVGTGWSKERKAIKMALPSLVLDLVSSNLKFQWKLCMSEKIVCSVDASLYREDQYWAVTCVLTQDSVLIVNEEEDAIQHGHSLASVSLEPCRDDPTLSVLKVFKDRFVEARLQPTDRVAQFVLDSLLFAGTSGEQCETDVVYRQPEPDVQDEYLLYLNPALLDWFVQCLDYQKANLGSNN